MLDRTRPLTEVLRLGFPTIARYNDDPGTYYFGNGEQCPVEEAKGAGFDVAGDRAEKIKRDTLRQLEAELEHQKVWRVKKAVFDSDARWVSSPQPGDNGVITYDLKDPSGKVVEKGLSPEMAQKKADQKNRAEWLKLVEAEGGGEFASSL